MLNPSTADASRDDPTIRRCLAFSKAWGFGAMTVVNIFALRATDPARLARASDPVGPDNDQAILEGVDSAAMSVAAWGVHAGLRHRGAEVLDLLADRPVHCLGTTQDGSPRHPLYMARSSRARPYRARDAMTSR